MNEEKAQKEIHTIIKKYPYNLYNFFSFKAQDRENQCTTLGLCYTGDVPNGILALLEEKLEESEIPYEVIVVQFGLSKCKSFIS